MKNMINKYGEPEAVVFSNNKNDYHLIWEFEDTFQINDNQLLTDNILNEFQNILLKSKDKDRILIYFSGHAETMDLPHGQEVGFLVPIEADVSNPLNTSISISTLQELSDMSNARHILFLIDACLGGMPNIISKKFST